jgi:hypothetical protein
MPNVRSGTSTRARVQKRRTWTPSLAVASALEGLEDIVVHSCEDTGLWARPRGPVAAKVKSLEAFCYSSRRPGAVDTSLSPCTVEGNAVRYTYRELQVIQCKGRLERQLDPPQRHGLQLSQHSAPAITSFPCVMTIPIGVLPFPV